MKESTRTGMNRTGMGTAPRKGKEQEENSWRPVNGADGDPAEIDRLRAEYEAEAETVGTVPPPSSLKGMLKTTVQFGMGRNPTAFIDKLGERLAFERTGTRLYELLLVKLEFGGSRTGSASAEVLRSFRDEEMMHFRMVWESLEKLGADPTVQTPSADLTGVKGIGLVQLMADPRTTFSQGLDAMLIAELTDNEGWRLLITMAEAMGQDAMADSFRAALADEDRHLERIREWWADLNLREADVDASMVHSHEGEGPTPP